MQGQQYIRLSNSLLWSKNITLEIKMTIHIAIVEPITTYGSEN